MVNSLSRLALERFFSSWVGRFCGILTVCTTERDAYHFIDCTRGGAWPFKVVDQR